MELNVGTRSRLRQMFKYYEGGNGAELNSNLDLDANTVFNQSLLIDIKPEEIEVPIIARNHCEKFVLDTLDYPYSYSTEKIILPLYNNSLPSIRRRTFDSILNTMIDTPYSTRIQKIVTTKDNIYYGGKGILLDSDFSPLFICTIIARKVKENNQNYLLYYRPICHINPKVFLDPNNLVNKGIIKKLIPFFASEEVLFPEDINKVRYALESRKVKVVVDNFDSLFIRPVKPTPSACSNEALNQCLVDNIEDILMLI